MSFLCLALWQGGILVPNVQKVVCTFREYPNQQKKTVKQNRKILKLVLKMLSFRKRKVSDRPPYVLLCLKKAFIQKIKNTSKAN